MAFDPTAAASGAGGAAGVALALWFLKKAVSAGTFDRLTALEARVAAAETANANLRVSMADGSGKFRELFGRLDRLEGKRDGHHEEEDADGSAK